MAESTDGGGQGKGECAALHTLNPTGRFTDRVGDYVRFRPSYPPEAIDAMLAGLGDPAKIRAADIGAGTGISARLLADRGVQVTAVEPNEAMRRAAGVHTGIRWVAATAEATTLGDASQDLVVCAQAFHWFRAAEALRDFARILCKGGRLALVWNQRDRHDPLTCAYTAAIVAAATDPQVERMPFDASCLTSTSDFVGYGVLEFAFRQRLDLAGLIGRATSASYVPSSGPGHERLVRDLTAAHGRHADSSGMVELVYRTQVHTAARA
ncbi:MAG TPA: class I SAM-dependent methyltransferase [Phycisphaerales bacterium]|nr:class I SAM-dependent methyltransferase [Phycisphaerales bacterium]